jgi:hypothetical protein
MPEDLGPYAVDSWSAGSVMAAGANIPVEMYAPTTPHAPAPVVTVMHGNFSNGAKMATLALTLASRGIIAVVPDMPCGISGCDHEANARQLLALLDWAVAGSLDPTSRLFGRIDGTRRGVLGHSFGALASEIAASMAPDLRVAVLLDPNDDFNLGRMSASSVSVPSAHLVAEVRDLCNSIGDWPNSIYPLTQPPHMRLRVLGSGHCDVVDPDDPLCEAVCSGGSRSTVPMFRRYAVAFSACALLGDRSMASFLVGEGLAADLAQRRVDSFDSAALVQLPCAIPTTSVSMDAGMDAGPGPDAVWASDADDEDAGSMAADAPSRAPDVPAIMFADASTVGVDAAAVGRPRAPSSCHCTAAERPMPWFAIVLLGLLGWRGLLRAGCFRASASDTGEEASEAEA